MKNNEIADALSEIIEATINHFIDTDVYYYIAPYLSQKEIDKTCPFFADNRITLPDHEISSDDLKTIAYLSVFFRNRVAYNPKFIDHYLRSMGHIPYNENAMDIVCFEKTACGSETKNILYSEWVKIGTLYPSYYLYPSYDEYPTVTPEP